jgi:hypothetical protein
MTHAVVAGHLLPVRSAGIGNVQAIKGIQFLGHGFSWRSDRLDTARESAVPG